MADQDEYKFTHRRTTNELEHDDSTTPDTKRVSMYGWYTASASKSKVVTDADGHLQIDVLSGGGGGTLVTSGEAVASANTAVIVVGSDGSNYRNLATDADGNLQVDVLTGGGAGEQYADGVGVSAAAKGNLILGTDGTNYQILNMDATGNAQVDVITIPTVSVQATAFSIRNLDSSADSVEARGAVADDATAATFNPVLIGGKAVNIDATDPTEIAEADVGVCRTDLQRRLLVSDTAPWLFTAQASGTASCTATSLQSVVSSAHSLYLTDLVISVSGANNITISEGTSTATSKIGPLYLAANGGVAMPFKTPLKFGANKAIGYLASLNSSFSIVANGYTAP